jgi:exodeoxyribonuclease V alpha subunit
MKIDPDSGKIKDLSSEDIGQTLSDVVVKVSRIIYPRTDKGFVIFACDGGFSCAGQSGENIVAGALYKVSGKVTEYNGQAQIKLSSVTSGTSTQTASSNSLQSNHNF